MTHNAIHLGLELELIISGPKVSIDWDATAKEMARVLTVGGIETEVLDKTERIPLRWVVNTNAIISEIKYPKHADGIKQDERKFCSPPQLTSSRPEHALIKPAK